MNALRRNSNSCNSSNRKEETDYYGNLQKEKKKHL